MFNKYALAKKSYYSSSQKYDGFYGFYDNYTGQVIGDIYKLSFAEEIRKNTAILTVIENQLGIIKSAELEILKKDKNKADNVTTYQPAIDFLNILNNPNTYPSPKHWNDIVKGIYKAYISNGIVALILRGGITKEINNIEIASYVSYNNSNGVISYNIHTTGNRYNYARMFTKNNDLNAFVNGDDIAIIFGNFDEYDNRYKTPLEPLQDVILWSNHIIKSSRAFYENSCRPSSIMTVEFLDEDGRKISSGDKATKQEMMKIISDIKTQLKGTEKTGGVLLPNQPHLKVNVTPLSIVQNANDIKEQLALTEQMIYALFAGTNKEVIQGLSKYEGNREMSLVEFYDSTIAYFTNIILDELNAFLPNWLQYVGTGNALQREGLYLHFNLTKIQKYKDVKISKAIELAKSQIITKEEARTKLREYTEDYGSLEILSDADDGFIGVKKDYTL